MNIKGDWSEARCFGSTTVGPKGQVVIPVSARKELDIDTGATLLVFKSFHGRGLVLLKAAAVEEMLTMMSEHLSGFEKLVKDYRSQKQRTKSRGVTR